jgi:glyoxylase-like metal-dependent hydrolase (beta-lactamase superfamily II)
MIDFKILIEGYTSGEAGGRSCSTITLIRDGKMNMIIDPGTVPDQRVLIDALAEENLSVHDINVVGITHAHTDHYRNAGMFPEAKIIDYWGWWCGNIWEKSDGKASNNVKILKTPGHSDDGITFLARTNDGIIAVCGDVFWKKDFPKKDPYATDSGKLAKSRQLILRKADWIIPGHGGIFENLKSEN